MGDCFGRETVRPKEEEEEEEGEGGRRRRRRSAGTKRSWPGVYRVSVSAGHDRSSMPIAARREQSE